MSEYDDLNDQDEFQPRYVPYHIPDNDETVRRNIGTGFIMLILTGNTVFFGFTQTILLVVVFLAMYGLLGFINVIGWAITKWQQNMKHSKTKTPSNQSAHTASTPAP